LDCCARSTPMGSLGVHTRALLKFYLRNRLILAFTLVVLALWLLSLIPMILFESPGSRFDTLRSLSSQLHDLVWFATAAFGLFAVWSHTSNRSTSLIFTRPVKPEAWTAAVFLSAFIVAAAGHLIALLLTAVLSVAWKIPLQPGFVWTAVNGFFQSVIVISGLTALATAIHPVLAVFAFAVFSESLFYQLDTLLLSYLQGRTAGLGIRLIEYVVRGIHLTLPMLSPFAKQTQTVEVSLRVASSDWAYLASTATYAALVFLFFFLFADYALRRRAAA
jgi:hypothetical protein